MYFVLVKMNYYYTLFQDIDETGSQTSDEPEEAQDFSEDTVEENKKDI